MEQPGIQKQKQRDFCTPEMTNLLEIICQRMAHSHYAFFFLGYAGIIAWHEQGMGFYSSQDINPLSLSPCNRLYDKSLIS